jgi:hypothetical protein
LFRLKVSQRNGHLELEVLAGRRGLEHHVIGYRPEGLGLVAPPSVDEEG